MYHRFVIVSKPERIEKEFVAKFLFTAEYATYNACARMYLPAITSFASDIELFRFGFIPENSMSDNGYYLYAPAERINYNKTFQGAIRNRRCVILANCYIVFRNSDDQPFLVYSESQKLLTFAGIYNTWVNSETKERINSFAIITTKSNDLGRLIGIDEMPFIINKGDWRKWLSASNLSDVTQFLKNIYPASKMNAFPIGNAIQYTRNDAREFIEPIGQPIYKREEFIYELKAKPKESKAIPSRDWGAEMRKKLEDNKSIGEGNKKE